MKHLLAAAVLMTAGSGLLLGSVNSARSHGEEAGTIPIGKPGEAARAKRMVNITMMEKEDGSMVFEPAVLKVREGETVRLKFTNKGEMDHEFVMDTTEGVLEHKVLMEKFPEMEHADPNSIRLAPGAKGEIIWTFVNTGDFTFACLIPGHYDAGMKGDITVAH
jgi:uncharacterized cupredoxin-like copper-binding protein